MPTIVSSKRHVVSNAIALLAILAIAALASALTRTPPQSKERLYDAMFSERDLFAICEVLSEQGFAHETTEDRTILVEPARLWAARATIAQAGLPRDRLIRMPRMIVCEERKSDGRTATEREMTRQQQLEGELAFCLRQIPGVRDAQIKLAIPKKCYSFANPRQMTARALLDLDPGHPLSKRSLQGMHHLIEESVPELLSENIMIVDTSGRDLTLLAYPQSLH